MRLTPLFLASCFLILGCSTKHPKIIYVRTINHTWQLAKINGKPASENIKLKVDAKAGKFAGNDGCNQIMGALEKVDDENLTFGLIASTRVACEDMESPRKYTKLLENVRSYKAEDDDLKLFDVNRSVVLEYKLLR